MDNLGLTSCRLRNDLINLVPRKNLIGGDMEGVPDGLRVAQKPYEAFCKIGIMRNRPK